MSVCALALLLLLLPVFALRFFGFPSKVPLQGIDKTE
jgi:hypothetical protein